MGALGIFNTALAYYVYFRLVNEEGPTFATLNNYIAPLIGVVGGAIVLAEPDRALGLGGTGARAGWRGPHRPIAARRRKSPRTGVASSGARSN